MDQIFNELSLSSSLKDTKSACDALLKLKEASAKLDQLGITLPVHVSYDFADREIIPNCTVRNFLKQLSGGKNRTLRQWLLKYWSNAPFIENLCDNSGLLILDEYSFHGQICKGLALAHIWDSPALSLSGDQRFNPPYVDLCHSFLDEISEEIKQEVCRVIVICQELDAIEYEKIITKRRQAQIKSGHDLLEYVRRHLPMIIIGTRACEQLESMQNGYPLLPRILSIFNELHRAMNDAIDNKSSFLPKGFKYSPFEGEIAMQGSNANAHKFTFIEENKQDNIIYNEYFCEAHMRITKGARVYFYADILNKKIYVGHVGNHLPCKRY